MRRMKDSGIAWIGKIPEVWDVRRIGICYAERNEKVSDRDYPPLSVTKFGVCPQLESAAKTDNGDNRKKVCCGDFVINGRSDRKGSCGISNFDGSVSLINIVIFPRDGINNNYFSFVFKSNMFSDEFYKWGNGIVDDLWSTKWQNMKKIFVPFPSYPEQHRIASYLDNKCAEIDRSMELVRQSMDKLKAYKMSVITEAVTKGFDPDVPMKDSGVPWIGEIPEGWDAVRLKHICSKITDGSHFSPETTSDGYPYITAKDVTQRGLDYASTLKISEKAFMERAKSGCMPEKGDVLLVKDGATTGRVGLMVDSTPCVVLSSVAMLHPQKNILSIFLMYLIQSNILQEQILLSMAGSAIPRVTIAKLVNYWGTLPPIQEQHSIAVYLDTKCAEIDAIIAKKQELLDKLAAYKKSLIFECVTGKWEVAA